MTDFDPDAYLTQASSGQQQTFDPDAYLRKAWTGPPEPGLQGMYQAGVGTVSNAITQGGRAMTQSAVQHGITNPYVAGAIGTLPAAGAAVGSLFLGGAGEEAEEAAVGAEHPLAEAAQEEAARVAGIRQNALNVGFPLTEKAISPTQQIVNKLTRDDLDLPTAAANGIDAPLTPNMLHVGNAEYVAPVYNDVRAFPNPVKISPYTQATIKDVRQLLTPNEAAILPTGDTMTANQAVDASIALRGKANQIPDNGINTTTMQSWQSVGKAHIDAARALEGDVKSALTNDGQGDLANAWDAARVYRAKSGAYEDALDGAGNVLPMVLKKQLLKQGVPLSDNAEMMANIAASHPELFKPVPTAPQPGLLRKAAAAAVPAFSAGIGAHFGGPVGAAAGSTLGEHYGQKLLNPP